MKQIFCLLLLFSSATVMGQDTINLWSDANPAPHRSLITTPESEPDQGGRIIGTSVPTIQVFLPKAATAASAVIICPGGSYYLSTTYNEGTYFADFLAQNGIAGIVLKYRMPAGVHQIPLEDVERAMQIVTDSASVWGINPKMIGVMGFSAGGHLAATAATLAAKKPAFSVLFYPVISMRKGLAHEESRGLLFGELPLRDYYSAELNVTPQVGPTLIFHSLDDDAVSIENAYIYDKALAAAGVKHKLVVYDKGGHGWGFSSSMPSHDDMKKELIEWLKAL